MAAFDPWGNVIGYDPKRDEQRLAELTDAQLIELFGIPEDAERVIPANKLASPTLGAVRRAQGIAEDPAVPFAHMLPEARVAFAFELVQEARRRLIADRLDGISMGLSVGANPEAIVGRLRRLVEESTP
jgi:hypothetical protein